MIHQVLEQLQFLLGQAHRLPGFAHFGALEVYFDAAEKETARRNPVIILDPSEQRFDARQKLGRSERARAEFRFSG